MNLHVGQYWQLLKKYLRPHWPTAILLAILLCGANALALLGPWLLSRFIDQVIAGTTSRELVVTATLFIVTSLGGGIVTVVESYAAENLGWIATNRLRADLALHLLRLDLSFHHDHTPGEIIARLDGDVTALANFFSRFVIYVVGNIILLAGIVVLLCRENRLIGGETSLFAVLILVAMLRLYSMAHPIWSALDGSNALFDGFIGEQLAATEDIRSCGATTYSLLRLTIWLRQLLPLQLKATLMGQLVWVAALNLSALATAGGLMLGTLLVQNRAVSVGTLYLIYQYTAMLVLPIAQLQGQIQDFQKAGAAIGRVQALFSTQSCLIDGTGVPIPQGPLDIDLDGVTFSYDGSQPVLCDINLRLEPGTILGLIGRTGSGKTTLGRLLFRFSDPTQGTVRLGGTDLRCARLSDVRRRVSLVTQEVHIFAASVRDNLTFFDPQIADSTLIEAITELGLEEWFQRLPAGLDTVLGIDGVGLSAGEAQLLAFVRVLLRQPDLVILDEASARLDPATEGFFDHAVARLLAERTAVIIAHRLNTLARADKIAVLDAGRIIELGSHRDLTADPHSYYYRVLHAQQQQQEIML